MKCATLLLCVGILIPAINAIGHGFNLDGPDGPPRCYEHIMSKDEHSKTVCEHETMHLQCGAGKRLRIMSVLYGRRSRNWCSAPKKSNPSGSMSSSHGAYVNLSEKQLRTGCPKHDDGYPLVKVKGMCDGKNSCSIPATNKQFGDPCKGVKKYLSVKYQCYQGKNGCVNKWTPISWHCCSATDTVKCGVGQGDCDSDDDCAGDLACGNNNCVKDWGGHRWDASMYRPLRHILTGIEDEFDCCYKVPPEGCN